MKHRTFTLLLALVLTLSACTPRGEEAPPAPTGSTPSASDALSTSPDPSDAPAGTLLSYEFTLPGMDNQTGPKFNAETDFNNSLGSMGFTDGGEGYYFTVPAASTEGYYLCYISKETLEAVAVCNKPNCQHYNRIIETTGEHETREEYLEEYYGMLTECGAYLHDLNTVYVYKGALYGIGNPDPFDMDTGLWRISPDGTKREKLQTFRFEENYDEKTGEYILENTINVSSSMMPLHRGKLYYKELDYINGIEAICRLDLEKPTAEPEQIYRRTGGEVLGSALGAALGYPIVYDNYMYQVEMPVTPQTDAPVDINSITTTRWDLTTFETISIKGNTNSVFDGKLLITRGDEDVLTDLDGNNPQVLYTRTASNTSFISQAAGGYLITSGTEDGRFYLFDKTGNPAGRIQMAGGYDVFCAGDENHIIFKPGNGGVYSIMDLSVDVPVSKTFLTVR